MFYSPYLKVDYPSTVWENVDDIIALVAVGYVSSSSAREWMSGVIYALGDQYGVPRLPTDTLTALESPAVILSEIKAKEKNSVSYARYVRVNKNGELDLNSLMSALKTMGKDYAYEYPIFVGLLPKVSKGTAWQAM